MYYAHTTSETYAGLTSFQTAMSFQSGSSLFFEYIFSFFLRLISKIMQPIWYKLIINLKMKNKILIFGIKKIILNSILPNCNIIVPNSPRNIIISSLPFKFSLEVKIYKKIFSVISINDPN